MNRNLRNMGLRKLNWSAFNTPNSPPKKYGELHEMEKHHVVQFWHGVGGTAFMLNYLDKMDLNIFTVDYYCVEWWCAGRTYPVGVTSRS